MALHPHAFRATIIPDPPPLSMRVRYVMRKRSWVIACASGTFVFLVSFVLAMGMYPGGTWFDSTTRGHSFTMNFLCDLLSTRALNGHIAHGAPLARAGMSVMFLAVAAFFALVAALDPRNRRGSRITLWSGWLACALGCVVPLFPSDRYPQGHQWIVLTAFVPALIASTAAWIVCMRTPSASRSIRVFAVLTLVAGALNGLGYAIAYAGEFGWIAMSRSALVTLVKALPALQRVATAGLLGWMASVCMNAWRNDPRARSFARR